MNNEIYMIVVKTFQGSNSPVYCYVGLDAAIKAAKSIHENIFVHVFVRAVYVYKTYVNKDGRIEGNWYSDEGCVYKWERKD